ncbi:hypothetical protein Q0590_29045 [Rhodocytophaga aerolata]|uniref:Uncharacterized protein n=1 Tax=Rhodocytophaga aerolata TaxID=455078 RepID=A0ABT8RGS7_9BACT|nr:hypothetical protein [Rhodocytophaga aerolata]
MMNEAKIFELIAEISKKQDHNIQIMNDIMLQIRQDTEIVKENSKILLNATRSLDDHESYS